MSPFFDGSLIASAALTHGVTEQGKPAVPIKIRSMHEIYKQALHEHGDPWDLGSWRW